MASRIADPFLFRADGVVTPWASVFGVWIKQLSRMHIDASELYRKEAAAVKNRPADIQLRWACAESLGLPFGPFTVWSRPAKDVTKEMSLPSESISLGINSSEYSFGVALAIIEITCTVVSSASAVGAFASRVNGTMIDTVGVASASGAAGARVSMRIRCAGATLVQIVNATDAVFRVQTLDSVVNDSSWKPIELVGLPIPSPWAGTAYDASPQGMVSALVDPEEAAMQRLKRAAPFIGWYPLTEAVRLAPTWVAADPSLLLKEIQQDLLPQVERLFRVGMTSLDHFSVQDTPAVAGPQRNGKVSSLNAAASLRPLTLLTLAAAGDPFIALATGFGTGYPWAPRVESVNATSLPDFLITGKYDRIPLGVGSSSGGGSGAGAEMAAFVPSPSMHGEMAAPTGLSAVRAGLVSPDPRDAAWRETVRVSWNRQLATAAVGRPTGASLVRYNLGSTAAATALQEKRSSGDFRPLLIVPAGAEGSPEYSRTGLVDAAAEIPLGSGGRGVGYGVAVQDAFGVWSQWEDQSYFGAEPALAAPRIIALTMDSTYAGSQTCPAAVHVELGVDWADRTPRQIALSLNFYRMAAANTPHPSGLLPTSAPLAGGFRRDIALTFTGDTLGGPAGVSIKHLDTAGELEVVPGVLQGEQGRRYRVRISVPSLDFGVTPRWGVRVWVRTDTFAALAGASVWTPDDTNPAIVPPIKPAIAAAASPVPVVPLAPPPLPGVPVGSAPDAAGCSHARIAWSMPAVADIQKIVVWEVAETALRQVAGLAQRAADTALPGQRLVDLRAAYNALASARRRSAFRRLLELPGDAREADITLPKGSKDIHLFTVTAVTSTGVESPWPAGAVPHEFLQAVAAPRLRQPAAPRVRAVVQTTGDVTLSLYARSKIPVKEFRLYRTRSSEAARKSETMGPSFAVLAAVAVTPVAGNADTQPDVITLELPYAANWTGAFAPHWDEWFVRAVAVPVDAVPERAERGQPSAASDTITLNVLPVAPPDLAVLTASIFGAAHDGVAVFSSTSAPMRLVSLGAHKVSFTAGAIDVQPIELQSLAPGVVSVAGPAPAGISAVSAAIVRGERLGGRSPLAVWFTRAAPTQAVTVVLRLADPLGRVTEQPLLVPGWVPPPPIRPTLSIKGVTRIAGRGVIVRLASNASLSKLPPWELKVTAIPPLTAPVTRTFPLALIPEGTAPFDRGMTIQAMRTPTAIGPIRRDREYQVFFKMTPPFTATFVLQDATGASFAVTARV